MLHVCTFMSADDANGGKDSWNNASTQLVNVTYLQVMWMVVTEVRSESFGLVTERPQSLKRMCNVPSVIFCLFDVVGRNARHIFIFSFLSALCAYNSKCGHHPHP